MYGSGVSSGLRGGAGDAPSARRTGWGDYRDTQYTSAAPLVVPANTRIIIPNNSGVRDESQLPEDVLSFYDEDDQRILVTNGSDFILTVRIRVRPTTIDATNIRVEMEITQAGVPVVVETGQRTLPWGIGVETAMNLTFSGYARESFAASGARLYLTSDGPIEVYGVSYVIKRTHKGV